MKLMLNSWICTQKWQIVRLHSLKSMSKWRYSSTDLDIGFTLETFRAGRNNPLNSLFMYEAEWAPQRVMTLWRRENYLGSTGHRTTISLRPTFSLVHRLICLSSSPSIQKIWKLSVIAGISKIAKSDC